MLILLQEQRGLHSFPPLVFVLDSQCGLFPIYEFARSEEISATLANLENFSPYLQCRVDVKVGMHTSLLHCLIQGLLSAQNAHKVTKVQNNEGTIQKSSGIYKIY